ncbi:MAG: thiamine phosphate synthase, partial [Chloroflexi bacterium]|nr:thiamine phosphate synthase [Chloroflexota bacterium]
RASQFLLAGADGIRVGSAIMHASDPKEATRIFASLWEETRQAP